MVPKCNNTCSLHKEGKYQKWKCGDVYSSEERHQIFLKNKIPCLDCGLLVSNTALRCQKCVGPILGAKRKGRKLSKEWVENIRKGQMLEKGNKWKGDQAGYSSIHKIIRKYYGNPPTCTMCGLVGSRPKRNWNIQWANVSGLYKRDISDWIGLCSKCHSQYDREKAKLRPGFFRT